MPQPENPMARFAKPGLSGGGLGSAARQAFYGRGQGFFGGGQGFGMGQQAQGGGLQGWVGQGQGQQGQYGGGQGQYGSGQSQQGQYGGGQGWVGQGAGQGQQGQYGGGQVGGGQGWSAGQGQLYGGGQGGQGLGQGQFGGGQGPSGQWSGQQQQQFGGGGAGFQARESVPTKFGFTIEIPEGMSDEQAIEVAKTRLAQRQLTLRSQHGQGGGVAAQSASAKAQAYQEFIECKAGPQALQEPPRYPPSPQIQKEHGGSEMHPRDMGGCGRGRGSSCG